MDENIATEATIPEEQTAETDTAPDTEVTETETTEEAAAEATTPETEATEETSEEETPALTIPVKYNKEYRDLTVEEATVLAQKGLKFDSLAPMMKQIEYMAAADKKTPAQIVQELYEARENSLLDRIKEKTGFDEELTQQLIELERSKAQKAYDAMIQAQEETEKQDKESVNTKLAGEFTELQKEFPDVKEFNNLPKTVIDTAVKKNISLLDSYLRYQRSETKKQTTAAKVQSEAAKASTGSQSSAEGNASDTVENALMSGIWGR